jgi:hypothetical protein
LGKEEDKKIREGIKIKEILVDKFIQTKDKTI